MLAPFTWGKGGVALTPEQIAQRRALAEAAREGSTDTSPVAHWTQGAARVVGALSGIVQDRRADKAEAEGLASADEYIANDPVLSALIGGRAAPALSSGGVAPVAGPVAGPNQDIANEAMAAIGQPAAASIMPASLIRTESGGNLNAYNNEVGAGGVRGHGGRGQFGQARLDDAAAAGIIPRMTPQEYANAPEPVQVAVENWHFGDIDRAIDQSGALGQTINGIPMTRDALRAVAHLGGIGGMNQFISTQGRYNPSDSFGTSLMEYAQTHGGGGMSASGQPVPITGGGGDVVGALASAMSNPWVAQKYGPVINALMDQQMKRGDMQYQQQLAQADPMRQLEMQRARLELDQMRNPEVDPFAGTQVINGQLVGAGQDGGFQVLGDFNTPEPGFEMVSPQEAASLGLPPGAYQRGADGKISSIGNASTVINNNMGGDEFAEAFAKGDAAALGTISESGMAAQRNIARIDQRASILETSPTGLAGAAKLLAGEWGINTEGLSELQAARAMINSLVPEQRQPGSGPMSDADLNLFKESLPRIINQPGGNQIIISTMRGIAEYDAQGAQIVQRLRAGEIDRAQAFAELQSRPDPMAQFRQTMGAMPQDGASGAPGAAAPAGLADDDLKWLEGN